MSESQEPAGAPEEGAPRREVVVREVDFSQDKGPGGCGLTGCLYGTVAVFAVLLLIVLGVALTRQWMTPVVAPGMGMP